MLFLTVKSTIIGIIAFVVILSLIIGIHEAGHMGYALKFGILVREYSIGMGPKIWHHKKGEIDYQIRCLPLGGFASIAGEEGTEDDPFAKVEKMGLGIKDGVITDFYLTPEANTVNAPIYLKGTYDIFDKEQTGTLYFDGVNELTGATEHFSVDPKAMVHLKQKESMQIAPYNRTLDSKPLWQQALVMFGGPLQNFVLAILAFFIFSCFTGFANTSSTSIGSLSKSSTITLPAAEVLKAGDTLTNMCVDDYSLNLNNWDDIGTFFTYYANQGYTKAITITYIDGETKGTKVVDMTPVVTFNSLGVMAYMSEDGYKLAYIAKSNNTKLLNANDLKVDDIVIGVGNTKSTQLVVETLNNYVGSNLETIDLLVLRDGQEINVSVKPYSKELTESIKDTDGNAVEIVKVYIGISPTYKTNILKSIPDAFVRTWAGVTSIYDSFRLLFSDSSVTIKALSGPVGIYQLAKTYSSYGLLQLLNLLGLLSVNIGLMNLLPIPALDGGRLVFIAYEAITKKKPSAKVQTILITVTMVLLLALMAIVSFNDIMNLIKK